LTVTGPGVRIPLSPLTKSPERKFGTFFIQIINDLITSWKLKIIMK